MTTPLNVNRQAVTVKAEHDTPLLWVLRGELGLTGTKFGCGIGQCGACTVQLDGQAMRSCSLPVQAVGQAKVTTIEGLRGREIDALRAAWTALDVVQCGYCQSGQLVAAAALLARQPVPSDTDIDTAMNGNICRCGTYPRIRAAIHQAAAALVGTGEVPTVAKPAPVATPAPPVARPAPAPQPVYRRRRRARTADNPG